MEDKRVLQADFSEILKNAYEKGLTETGLTVQMLIDQLKMDLKKLKNN